MGTLCGERQHQQERAEVHAGLLLQKLWRPVDALLSLFAAVCTYALAHLKPAAEILIFDDIVCRYTTYLKVGTGPPAKEWKACR